MMPVKFIQYWDVLSGKEEEFDMFLVENYVPGINGIGFVEILGSAFVIAGEGPCFILEGVTDSPKSVNRLLQDDEFRKLKRMLLFLVTDYETAMLIPTNRFENILLQGFTDCRFNQHYDIVSDRYDEYREFITRQHIPTLQKIGIDIHGEWEVCLGAGPNLIVEGRCHSAEKLLRAMETEDYRKSTGKLLSMSYAYGSKILIPSGHMK
jgi:hypothetical protein